MVRSHKIATLLLSVQLLPNLALPHRSQSPNQSTNDPDIETNRGVILKHFTVAILEVRRQSNFKHSEK